MCKVTFTVLGQDAKKVCVVGDFNNWDPKENELKRLKNGSFKGTFDIPKENSYEFRYLIDGNFENEILKMRVAQSEGHGFSLCKVHMVKRNQNNRFITIVSGVSDTKPEVGQTLLKSKVNGQKGRRRRKRKAHERWTHGMHQQLYPDLKECKGDTEQSSSRGTNRK